MTFDNLRGIFPFLEQMPLLSEGASQIFGRAASLSDSKRGMKLLAMALMAMSVAFLFSPPGRSVWAWQGSPVSPVSPMATETQELPSPTPTAQVIAPTATPEPPAPPDAESPQGTALPVAGGIVLVGLIAGAAVLLIRGQPSEERDRSDESQTTDT
jgi:hypothetical protein